MEMIAEWGRSRDNPKAICADRYHPVIPSEADALFVMTVDATEFLTFS